MPLVWTQNGCGDNFATSPSGRRYSYHYLSGLFVWNEIARRWDLIPSPSRLYSDADATKDVEAYEQSLEVNA